MSAAGEKTEEDQAASAIDKLAATSFATGAQSMQVMIMRALRDAGMDDAMEIASNVPVPTREDMVALHRKEGPTQQ